jgi:hypothetical protein
MGILSRIVARHKKPARFSPKMIVVARDDDTRLLSSENANKEISI